MKAGKDLQNYNPPEMLIAMVNSIQECNELPSPKFDDEFTVNESEGASGADSYFKFTHTAEDLNLHMLTNSDEAASDQHQD